MRVPTGITPPGRGAARHVAEKWRRNRCCFSTSPLLHFSTSWATLASSSAPGSLGDMIGFWPGQIGTQLGFHCRISQECDSIARAQFRVAAREDQRAAAPDRDNQRLGREAKLLELLTRKQRPWRYSDFHQYCAFHQAAHPPGALGNRPMVGFHDAGNRDGSNRNCWRTIDRKSTRLNSSHVSI